MTSASSLTEKPRVWRWEGRVLAILFGIGLLLWPFLSFGAIFMFDSPMRNRSDEVNRFTVAYFIWFYPVTYAAAGLLYVILRRCGVWRVVSCFAWGLPVAVYCLLPAFAGWKDAKDAAQTDSKRIQLLYRTDYAALLAACRSVMTNRNSLRHWEHNGTVFIDLKDPGVPAAMVALRPLSVAVGDDWVSMGLNGNIESLVVVAYSEQTAGSHTNGASGDLQLIPGLWFTDEGFSYRDNDRAGYLKKLRAMKPDDAPAPKW
jgi:hypothetical protein